MITYFHEQEGEWYLVGDVGDYVDFVKFMAGRKILEWETIGGVNSGLLNHREHLRIGDVHVRAEWDESAGARLLAHWAPKNKAVAAAESQEALL